MSVSLVKNTLFVYFRLLLVVGVSVFTVRVVLQNLGVIDYGIYNVIGGFVSMFAFIGASMSSASQRFFAFELGKKNIVKLNIVFNTTLLIYLFLTILLVFVTLTIGNWFVLNKLTIPENRLNSSLIVYYISIASIVFSMFAIPFNSMIIAKENMKFYAYISVLESILKLIIAYLLAISNVDKLIFFSFLNLCVSILMFLIYSFYCFKNFSETKLRYTYDKKVFKEILNYSSWNLIGNLAIVLKENGTNVLLNMYFNPVVNAARAISFQVNTVLNSFLTNLQTVVSPQITKNYSIDNNARFLSLIEKGTLFSFYLLFLISLPFIYHTEIILNIWLGEFPKFTLPFIKIILVTSLVDSLYRSILSGHLATGDIKKLQIIVGGINILLLPTCFFLLKIYNSPIIVFIMGLIFSLLCLIIRLLLFKKVVPFFSFKRFWYNVLSRILLVSSLSTITLSLFSNFFTETSILNLIYFVLFELLSVGLIIFFLGISKQEREYFLKFIKDKLNLINFS